MSGYHGVGLAIDVSVTPGLQAFVDAFGRFGEEFAGVIASVEGRLLVAGYSPPRRKTASAYRTRSPRWRAGTRRTRRLVRDAKRHGRPSPSAPPWSGWTQVGTTDADTPPADEQTG